MKRILDIVNISVNAVLCIVFGALFWAVILLGAAIGYGYTWYIPILAAIIVVLILMMTILIRMKIIIDDSRDDDMSTERR